jgi:hypothetical protein
LELTLSPRQPLPQELQLFCRYRYRLFFRPARRLVLIRFFRLQSTLKPIQASRPILFFRPTIASRFILSSGLQLSFRFLQSSRLSSQPQRFSTLQLFCQHRLFSQPRQHFKLNKLLVFRKVEQLPFRSQYISKQSTLQEPQLPLDYHKSHQSPSQILSSHRSHPRYNSELQHFQPQPLQVVDKQSLVNGSVRLVFTPQKARISPSRQVPQ